MFVSFKNAFGGNVTLDKAATNGYERKNGRMEVWRWKAIGPVAKEFLAKVYPFSVVKEEQIALALEWPEGDFRGKANMPYEVWEKRRNIMFGLREIRNKIKVKIDEC